MLTIPNDRVEYVDDYCVYNLYSLFTSILYRPVTNLSKNQYKISHRLYI